MPTTELKPTVTTPGTGDRTYLTCAACPHAWDAHDPIGIRYCSATVASGRHRGCVCVGDTRNEDRQ
ncbi:MAG TPA: RGCVC family protein [Pseudonocardiaceae bacterium]|nr:RGCVC family protein [Pseudonocardiaceae bacterium]